MRATGYLRVSTEGQTGEDKYGLDAQKQSIESFAACRNIEIVGWYRDEGVSGATLSRPGLQALLADAGEGRFETVLVAKMDRIARDLFLSLWVEKELMTHGIDLISVSEPFEGKDPMSVAFRQMIALFAELEKHRIKERMAGGRLQKARQGGYAGGGAPFGYRNTRGSKSLALDPTQAQTILRVFELKDSNPRSSLQSLADLLNAEGLRPARGKRFYKATVKAILDRREFYSGVYSYAGVAAPGKHSPILVSEPGRC